MQPLLRIGTRKSPLALRQVELVLQSLAAVHPMLEEPEAVEVVPIITSGDRIQDVSLEEVGGKGLFTKEIDEALLQGRIDIAVHSAKDLQTVLPKGIHLSVVLEREDVRDVLVSEEHYTLGSLPRGAVLGTASQRRGVQIKAKRPDIELKLIRGNIHTRMDKIARGDYSATVLALAGLQRMRIEPLPGVILSIEDMLPAVAQGTIAITTRAGDAKINAFLKPVNHADTMAATLCERTLLAGLDGSCRTPIAGYAKIDNGQVTLKAMLADPNTNICQFAEGQSTVMDAVKLGVSVAQQLKSSLR